MTTTPSSTPDFPTIRGLMDETRAGYSTDMLEAEALRCLSDLAAMTARVAELERDAKRWRGVEHAMQHVSLTPIAGEPTTFDPRDVKHLVSMRQFVDSTIERHIAKLQAAIDAAGRK